MIFFKLLILMFLHYTFSWASSFQFQIGNTSIKKDFKKPQLLISTLPDQQKENIPQSNSHAVTPPNMMHKHDKSQNVSVGMINNASSQKMTCLIREDSAALAAARPDQVRAFKKISTNLMSSIQQHTIPDIQLEKSLNELTYHDFAQLLISQDLLEERDIENISIERIESTSNYAESVFKIFRYIPEQFSPSYVFKNTTKSSSPTRKLLFIIKVHRPQKISPETLHSEIGVKLHNSLRQQNTSSYPQLPTLSFTEKIVCVHLNDGARYMSVIHVAQGTPLGHYIKSVQESTKDLDLLMMSLGNSLGTFHAYHALRNNSLQFYDTIQKQQKEEIHDIFSFNTITHGDLHVENIFIDQRHNSSIFRLIDLESMFLGALDLKENRRDTYKLLTSIEAILGVPKLNKIINLFYGSYNQAVLNTTIQHKKEYIHRIKAQKRFHQ